MTRRSTDSETVGLFGDFTSEERIVYRRSPDRIEPDDDKDRGIDADKSFVGRRCVKNFGRSGHILKKL